MAFQLVGLCVFTWFYLFRKLFGVVFCLWVIGPGICNQFSVVVGNLVVYNQALAASFILYHHKNPPRPYRFVWSELGWKCWNTVRFAMCKISPSCQREVLGFLASVATKALWLLSPLATQALGKHLKKAILLGWKIKKSCLQYHSKSIFEYHTMPYMPIIYQIIKLYPIIIHYLWLWTLDSGTSHLLPRSSSSPPK